MKKNQICITLPEAIHKKLLGIAGEGYSKSFVVSLALEKYFKEREGIEINDKK